ncbi:hypothetical protein ACFP1C_13770 [Levilactobacillus fujinensis]|uniref:Uncharacterized protein n=1 Tax=Levilactobacillus fujinensis TaxID=2486024 RepID=A0ABW1TJ32_9LACO
MKKSTYWHVKFLRTPVGYENLAYYRFQQYEKYLKEEHVWLTN